MNHTGQSLKQTGIQLSLDNAEIKCDGWQQKAMSLLQQFIIGRTTFMCEDFREFCEKNGLPIPPSKRAFGGIIAKAAANKLIKQVGYGKVKNPLAHQANAAIWEPIKNAA